ncbi:MAG: NUDIX domain-containing protein [Promethearchaeota archaeon]
MNNKYKAVISITTRRKDDKVLLIHRTNPPITFSPPGGFFQKSLKFTTKKEVEEETGMNVKQYLGKFDVIKNNIAVTGNIVEDTGLIKCCNEWDIIGWFDYKNIDNLSPSKENNVWNYVLYNKNRILGEL